LHNFQKDATMSVASIDPFFLYLKGYSILVVHEECSVEPTEYQKCNIAANMLCIYYIVSRRFSLFAILRV
jgi:hypothetical protein